MNDPNEEIYKVKKPATNNSQAIRNTILKEYFGYTDADIEALNASKPKLFFIEDTNALGVWATENQVRSWKVDADGFVSIPLKKDRIKQIKVFREQRLIAQIYAAIAFITDTEARTNALADLQKIFSLSESERIEGLSNLILSTNGKLGSASQISAAVTYLTDRAGYRDNPLLILVKANAAFTEAQIKIGPGYDVNALTLLAEAVRKAGNNFNFGAEKSVFTLKRQELAFINRHASYLYAKLGDEPDARERDWVARFYGVGDVEGETLNEGDMIEFVSPTTAVGTPQPLTSAQEKLDELKIQREKVVELQNKTDKIGSEIVPTDHRTSELFQSPTDGFTTEASVEKKIRSGQKGYKGQFKIVTYKEYPYQKANVLADGYGAVLELPLKVAKYGNTMRRLYEITAYLNKRDKLLRQIRNENRYVVPPKPQDVMTLIKQVERYGRIINNPFEKNRASITLQDLNLLWEESNAFWKNRK